jgi:hypothetical protein
LEPERLHADGCMHAWEGHGVGVYGVSSSAPR